MVYSYEFALTNAFFLDAECVLDAKNNPLPLDGTHKDATR